MFEGKKGEVLSSSSELRRSLRSITIVVITVTFLAVVYYIVLSYYINASETTGNENFQESYNSANPIRVSNQNSVLVIRDGFYFDSVTSSAFKKKSLSVCDDNQLNLDEQTACKIIIASQLNDSSYCSSTFESSTKVPLMLNPPENALVSFQDYCWFRFSRTHGINYCGLMKLEKGREICLQMFSEANIRT